MFDFLFSWVFYSVGMFLGFVWLFDPVFKPILKKHSKHQDDEYFKKEKKRWIKLNAVVWLIGGLLFAYAFNMTKG